MSEDATSQPSDQTTDNTSATEDDNAQQMLADAVTQTTADTGGSTDTTPSSPDGDKPADTPAEDKLGDGGRRALTSERKARREAEKQLSDMRTRLQQYEDAQKTELQKAQDAAKRYEQELTATRVANARLMSAAIHNLPHDLIELLGDGTDEEIDARAKLLAEKLTAPAPAAPTADTKPAPAKTRPVESLTPGAKPASAEPEDPNAWLRRMAGRAAP